MPWISIVRHPCHAAQPTSDICVDNDRTFSLMQRQPGPSSVHPDTGQPEQLIHRARKAVTDHGPSNLREHRSSPMQAQSLRQRHGSLGARAYKSLGGRVPFSTFQENRLDLARSRPLQEKLGDEGQPRIGLISPRVAAKVRPAPAQQALPDPANSPVVQQPIGRPSRRNYVYASHTRRSIPSL